MDETFFWIGGLIIPLGMTLLMLALRHKEKDIAPAFGFFGFLIGILTTTSANTDGSITVAYNSSVTIGLWPALYYPIIFILLALFATLYTVLERVRF